MRCKTKGNEGKMVDMRVASPRRELCVMLVLKVESPERALLSLFW